MVTGFTFFALWFSTVDDVVKSVNLLIYIGMAVLWEKQLDFAEWRARIASSQIGDRQMTELKVGVWGEVTASNDELFCIGTTIDIYNGDVGVITNQIECSSELDGLNSGWVATSHLKPLQNKPHKHRDLIIAWANGAEIEYQDHTGEWEYIQFPEWLPSLNYRIKPSKQDKIKKLQQQIDDIQKEIDSIKAGG